MKPIMLCLAVVLSLNCVRSIAQVPNNSESIKQQMSKIQYMSGKWKGEATIRQQTGITKINQNEDVQFKLDGTILVIEGIGKSLVEDKVVFNAYGVISFNPYTKEYKLKSYTQEGNQADAYFKIITDNHFEWGFETPNKAKIKYDIVLNPLDKTWIEKGEYSPDGNMWFPFFEMKLSKLE